MTMAPRLRFGEGEWLMMMADGMDWTRALGTSAGFKWLKPPCAAFQRSSALLAQWALVGLGILSPGHGCMFAPPLAPRGRGKYSGLRGRHAELEMRCAVAGCLMLTDSGVV